jgi:hypothetical protein
VTSTKFKRLIRYHRLQITRESQIVANLLRFKRKIRYRDARLGKWHSKTAKAVKDDGASENLNYVSRSYVEDLQKAGANLEIEDDGWMVVETANANVENVVERCQRVSLSVHIGSYVYKARFTIYDVKGFDIVLGKRWMRDINGRYHIDHYNANPAPPPAPIHHLRRFGCRAYRLIPEKQRLEKKLGARSRKCMMVGYVHHSTKLWKLYDPEFKKVLHCSDVDFDEDVNCYISCPTMIDDGIDPFGLPTREPIHVEYYESEPIEESSRSRTLSTTSCATTPVDSLSADDSEGSSYFAAGAQKARGAGSSSYSSFAAGAQKAGARAQTILLRGLRKPV